MSPGRVYLLIIVACLSGGPVIGADNDLPGIARLADPVPTLEGHDPTPYEKQLKATLITGATAVDTMFLAGLVPPPYSQIFETAEWLEDLTLKHLPALLVAPENLEPIFPNSQDQCSFKFVLPQSEVEFTNYFGVVNARRALGAWYEQEDPALVELGEVNRIDSCMMGFPADSTTRFLRRKCDLLKNNWGVLGAPEHLWHANTDVVVSVSSVMAGIEAIDTPQIISMPAGVHELVWAAHTQRDLVMDIIVPPVMIVAGVLTEFFFARYGDDILKRLDAGIDEASDGIIDAVKYGQFKKWVRAKAIEWIIKEGPKFGGEKGAQLTINLINADTSVTTVSTFDYQYLSVFDVFPPTIELKTGSEILRLEASAFGGTATRHHTEKLNASIIVSDSCGRAPVVTNDAPEFLRMGATPVTWTAADLGPNPPGDEQNYRPSTIQQVIVEDTQNPLVVAPPGIVMETDDPNVDQADVMLGTPLVADLADPEPGIKNDAPPLFEANSRTTVNWLVTDASGNSTPATQQVTIKPTGSNTSPLAFDRGVTTRTAEEVEIRLRASDPDLIDGMFDPVWFSIVKPPAHGQFVAPLLPFFIDDYRTRPTDLYGPDFAEAVELNQANAWIENNVCALDQEPVTDFVFNPLFAHVMDDGTRFLLDMYFTCNDDNNKQAHEHARISKWDANDLFLGQLDFGPEAGDLPSNDAFSIELDVGQDKYQLYYTTFISSGTSESQITLHQCNIDFESGGNICPKSYAFKGDSAADPYTIDVQELTTVHLDSQRGLFYLVDKSRLYVFEPGASGAVTFLGIMAPPGAVDGVFLEDDKAVCPSILNGRNFGYGLETDSKGNVYAADSCLDRIHKFTAPGFDAQGNFVTGDYVGWLGKCIGNPDIKVNACDVSKERSFGFTCSDATCEVNPNDSTEGDQSGQFNTPLYLVADRNDILYVADYENFRVQRFGPDGTFSGEAKSTGTGINSGDKPSFVLGNMDKPRALSVNSTQFFVVDRDTRFMHIFGTLPFQDITEDEVTVTYVSEAGFHNQNDHFSFRVNDGLDDSNIATVTIEVKRNHRRPKAHTATLSAIEDAGAPVQLVGTDPDGVVGQNENGLDILTFTIVTPPEQGELIAAGPPQSGQWFYLPEPDYYGPDQFSFRVNDGVFDSEPAIVEIDVQPVNDPPVLVLDSLPTVGRGFPATFSSTFTDDSAGEFTALQTWGDGSADIQGELVEDLDTGEYSFEVGKAISVQAPMDSQAGSTTAQHVYATLGPKQMSLCVADATLAPSCQTAIVHVEPLVAISLDGAANGPQDGIFVEGNTTPHSKSGKKRRLMKQIVAGEPVTFELQVTNLVPEFGDGLVALGVSLEATLDGALEVQQVVSSAGICQILTRTSINCDLGSMFNGDSIDILVVAVGPADIIHDEIASLDVVLGTDSPAVSSLVASMLSADILADDTDTDGDGMTDNFERKYGLDPVGDDSAGDLDGDGLTNLEEYQNQTSPIAVDTDEDGVNDFDELFVYGTDPLVANDPGSELAPPIIVPAFNTAGRMALVLLLLIAGGLLLRGSRGKVLG